MITARSAQRGPASPGKRLPERPLPGPPALMRDAAGLPEVIPPAYERRDSLGVARRLAAPAVRGLAAVNVETFRPAETKHAPDVRSFHRMQSFHVVAADGAAAPREPGTRGSPGSRGRCSFAGTVLRR